MRAVLVWKYRNPSPPELAKRPTPPTSDIVSALFRTHTPSAPKAEKARSPTVQVTRILQHRTGGPTRQNYPRITLQHFKPKSNHSPSPLTFTAESTTYPKKPSNESRKQCQLQDRSRQQ
uniref:Uncharacterized protein n=1 Tax=Physcomitrium patens TaxID=3218 RepID=A0A2K1JZE6_PHYPA|nr:hypothetical protein PHYPA_014023 [Physcomitrium patens]